MARGGSEKAAIDFDDVVRTGLGVTAPTVVALVSIDEPQYHSLRQTLNIIDLLSTDAAAKRQMKFWLAELEFQWSAAVDKIDANVSLAAAKAALKNGIETSFKRQDAVMFRELAAWLEADNERFDGPSGWQGVAVTHFELIAAQIDDQFSERN